MVGGLLVGVNPEFGENGVDKRFYRSSPNPKQIEFESRVCVGTTAIEAELAHEGREESTGSAVGRVRCCH